MQVQSISANYILSTDQLEYHGIAQVPYVEKIAMGIDSEIANSPTDTLSVIYSTAFDDGNRLMYTEKRTSVWSTPQLLLTPQYVNMHEKDLHVDNNSNVHIFAQYNQNLAYYITNQSGTWTNYSFTTGSSWYNLVTNPSGSKIYMVSLKQAGSPSSLWYIAYDNLSYGGPSNINHSQQLFDFSAVPECSTISFVDIAVNSTGYVYIVFKGLKDIFYFTVSPDGVQSSLKQISNATGDGAYTYKPVIKIGKDDRVHCIFQVNNAGNTTELQALRGIYYQQINSTVSENTAFKVGPFGYGWQLYIDFQNVARVVYFVELENQLMCFDVFYGSGIVHVRNVSHFFRRENYNEICSGLTGSNSDQPLFILSEINGTQELISSYGNQFGNQIEWTAKISSLKIDSGHTLTVSLNLKNLGPITRNFSSVASIVGIDQELIEFPSQENAQNQAVDEIRSGESKDLSFTMQFKSSYHGELGVAMLMYSSDTARGYLGVVWNVEATVGAVIPGFPLEITLIAAAFTIFYIIRQKSLKK